LSLSQRKTLDSADRESMMKKNVLALSAAAEAGTGLLLLASPPVVVWLLFGAENTVSAS